MSNTDKLLRAFIEASGFSIEEVTTKEAILSLTMGLDTVDGIDYKVTKKKADNKVYIEASNIDDALCTLINGDSNEKD